MYFLCIAYDRYITMYCSIVGTIEYPRFDNDVNQFIHMFGFSLSTQ